MRRATLGKGGRSNAARRAACSQRRQQQTGGAVLRHNTKIGGGAGQGCARSCVCVCGSARELARLIAVPAVLLGRVADAMCLAPRRA